MSYQTGVLKVDGEDKSEAVGSSDDTINDSGLFFSPQPLTSKLARCASTPLSDKSLQSLLTFDIDIGGSNITSTDHQKSSSGQVFIKSNRFFHPH